MTVHFSEHSTGIGVLPDMAEQQERQNLYALHDYKDLSHFVVEGRPTGKQLGTGSYGSVEEV